MQKCNRQPWLLGGLILMWALSSCGGQQGISAGSGGDAEGGDEKEGEMNLQQSAKSFLEEYLAEFERLELASTNAQWQAAISGKQEDYDALSRAELAVKKLHSDGEKYRKIEELLAKKDQLEPLTRRSLEVAYLEFKSNQLPLDLLEKMVSMSSEIQRAFNTFRGKIGTKEYSNNDLLDMLAEEKSSPKRRQIWEAMKQVGAKVGPRIVELAKVRNEAAQKLGYPNFWEMEVRLQEHDPARLMEIFAELEAQTEKPFKEMKTSLDKELSRRFKVDPQAMRPWHYDNPFFQVPPPSEKINLDKYYENKKKEDIVKIAERFFVDIGLPIDKIVASSDLYEREGKDQHAFCIDIDRNGDVRTLLNIKPTVEWMDTMLHEQGHAVFDSHLDFELPFNLREAAHIFATEAVAMLFGALAKNALFIADYAGGDPADLKKNEDHILEQSRRERLIFARWAMVMLHFEKALYEDPEQDLNKLWWDMVERFQMVTRPANRDAADWASKPHFTIAPVYYHNYMLGELFAAMLRAQLAEVAGHKGPMSSLNFKGQTDFGKFLKDKIFQPSRKYSWPEFVQNATGGELSAAHFAAEFVN